MEETCSPLQLKQRSRERTEDEETKGENLTEKSEEKKENVLEKPTSDVSVSESATFNGKIESDAVNPGMMGEEEAGWPTLPGSFFQNLDSPFLGKDDKMFNSLRPEFASHLRGPVDPILDSTDQKSQTPLQKGKEKPMSKTYTHLGRKRNILSGGVERKWREGEEGKEDVRRRRKVVARLRKLRQKSDAREEGGRDGEEEEEKAILSLEAQEGGVSLYKRIMDYTSKDFSTKTDPTTAIVNAASRHLD